MKQCKAIIEEVFLPSVISQLGGLNDLVLPPYIGFNVEILDAYDDEWASVVEGTTYYIIEKLTTKTAGFYKGDFVYIPLEFITHQLQTLSEDDWLKGLKVLMNFHDEPVMKRSI